MTSAADELRRVYPRVLAKTLAFTKSLPDAEDAVQEAVRRALEDWPTTGLPESPEAWLVTVAANQHRDGLRRARHRERSGDALTLLAEMSPWARSALGEMEMGRGFQDELLRLLFACCHPALEPGESAALALSTVIGLSTNEVATAFLVAPRTMEQRLTRARQRLRERGDADGTRPEEAHARLEAVLRTVHLLFNEGYWSTDDAAPIRGDLCRLALGLARSLTASFTESAEVSGLLALCLLHDARRGARLDERGRPVALSEQDRSRWDEHGIAEGTNLLERALASKRPGPFQIEAAISAVHCRARTANETDWKELAALYALLESFRATPAVRVNRAYALARAEGGEAGLALLEGDDGIDVRSYPYVHLVRGAILEELGRFDEARTALAKALDHARNAHESEQISARLARLEHPREDSKAALR